MVKDQVGEEVNHRAITNMKVYETQWLKRSFLSYVLFVLWNKSSLSRMIFNLNETLVESEFPCQTEDWEVTLPCSYRSTCVRIKRHTIWHFLNTICMYFISHSFLLSVCPSVQWYQVTFIHRRQTHPIEKCVSYCVHIEREDSVGNRGICVLKICFWS